MTIQQDANEVASKFGVKGVKATAKGPHLVTVSFEHKDVEYGSDIPAENFGESLTAWLQGLGMEGK